MRVQRSCDRCVVKIEQSFRDSRVVGSPFTFNISSSIPATAIYEVTLLEDGIYLFRVNNSMYAPDGPQVGEFSLLIEVMS